jgi:hypothetical protein
VLDIIFLIEQARRPQSSTKDLVRSLWANPSQCVTRLPGGHRPSTPTTSALVYSYAADAAISGDGMLRGMGWGRGFASQTMFSEHQLRNLSGERFSVPIISQLCFVLYINPFAPWRHY